jgi:hypothetical protein
MKPRAFAAVAAVCLVSAVAAAQLPAISWTCPMHPDVLEDKKGACGICGMDLEPVRLVTMYTCPVHAVIEQAAPGKCRICARDLVRKTAALTFTCESDRDVSQLEPGRCADGKPTIARYTVRAHGDHNPKHGGIFFMAPDNWHHIEGAYPAPGRFRVYVYDDFSRPLRIADARKVRGRIVTKEAFDSRTNTTRELASAPLVLARNGAFFEARIEPLALPASMTAKIAFLAGDKESRFDFTFPAYSRDLPAPAATTTTATPAAAPPAAPTPPRMPAALLTDLRSRREEVASLVEQGALGGLYVPALQAKDLALDIQSRQRGANQDAIEESVRQIVLAAYQLDTYGDLGDGEQVAAAYRRFSAAIARLDSIVSGHR